MLLCTDWPRLAIPQVGTEEVPSGLAKVSEVVQLFAGEWVTAGWSVRPGYWEKFVEWRKTRPRR